MLEIFVELKGIGKINIDFPMVFEDLKNFQQLVIFLDEKSEVQTFPYTLHQLGYNGL